MQRRSCRTLRRAFLSELRRQYKQTAVGILDAVMPEMIRPQKQPADGGCDCHDNVIQAETEAREQQNGPPAELIGKHADHGRKEKLHRCENSEEDAVPIGRARHVVVQKIQNQFRQHGRDQPEREHVEHDRDEDECDGSWACFHFRDRQL